MRTDDDAQHAYRHALHALEDFERLRQERDNEELWHALSHHLRHVAFRTGLVVPEWMRKWVRRTSNK